MPASCLACGQTLFRPSDRVSIEELGRAWATDRRIGGKPDTDAEWSDRIRSAVRADEIIFWQCVNCGLAVAEPARVWPEGAYPEDENYPVRWEFGRFLDDLGNKPLRLLELGCGAGTMLDLARQRGHDVLGLDFSPKAVAVARERGLNVLCGGFEQLRKYLAERGEGAFDAAAIFHAIEHLPDPLPLFTELRQFVRPGGILGISCPGPNRFTRLIAVQQVGRADFWDYPPHHVLRWTPASLSAFLTRAGWEQPSVTAEPLQYIGAAAQMGYTKAAWRGYANDRWRTRWDILLARLRLLFTRRVGLSLYARATRPHEKNL